MPDVYPRIVPCLIKHVSHCRHDFPANDLSGKLSGDYWQSYDPADLTSFVIYLG